MTLVYRDALNLLKANEQEEKAADAKLSRIAESTVNQHAVSAGVESEEHESARTSPSKRRRTA